MRTPDWERPLRAGFQPRVRDLGFIGLWGLVAAVTTVLHLTVGLPAWAWQLPLLGLGLQAVGVLLGLFLRDPRPEDYVDRKDL